MFNVRRSGRNDSIDIHVRVALEIELIIQTDKIILCIYQKIFEQPSITVYCRVKQLNTIIMHYDKPSLCMRKEYYNNTSFSLSERMIFSKCPIL